MNAERTMTGSVNAMERYLTPGEHMTLQGELQRIGAPACHEAVLVIQRLSLGLLEWQKLRDPVVLHANLLRGLPARLTRNQALHLIGDDADRIAEIEAENIRLREALAQASRLVGDEGEGAAWHERWTSLRPQGDSNVAG